MADYDPGGTFLAQTYLRIVIQSLQRTENEACDYHSYDFI